MEKLKFKKGYAKIIVELFKDDTNAQKLMKLYGNNWTYWNKMLIELEELGFVRTAKNLWTLNVDNPKIKELKGEDILKKAMGDENFVYTFFSEQKLTSREFLKMQNGLATKMEKEISFKGRKKFLKKYKNHIP